MSSGSLAAAKLRAAASSVAPIGTAIEAPCVLAALAFRSPETRQHSLKGHLTVNLALMLKAGDRIPEATVFLGPQEPVTMSQLLEDGPKLLVFYLFDWSST
jgi:hypothetical protein